MFEKRTPLQEPLSLLFYGVPKVGKTTLASMLPNSMILDFENGTNYIDHERVFTIKNSMHLNTFEQRYFAQDWRADFLILDSLTAIENMFDREFCVKYNQENPDKSRIKSASELPYGAGTGAVTNRMQDMIKYMSKFAKRIIYIGHVKRRDLSTDTINRVINELDLTGKRATIIPSLVDAIAYFYREENKLTMSFETMDDVIRGSRVKNLANQVITSEDGMDIWKTIYKETIGE